MADKCNNNDTDFAIKPSKLLPVFTLVIALVGAISGAALIPYRLTAVEGRSTENSTRIDKLVENMTNHREDEVRIGEQLKQLQKDVGEILRRIDRQDNRTKVNQ